MSGSPESNKPNREWQAQPKPQPEIESNPLVPLLREQRGEEERSHEEMVALIRSALEQERARLGDYVFDPALWMREQIIYADTRKMRADKNIPDNVSLMDNVPLGATPYAKLIMAWDIIASPYIKPRHYVSKNNAERGIRERAKILGHTITLDPEESKLLSAMAEAADIPHTYGPLTGGKKPLK